MSGQQGDLWQKIPGEQNVEEAIENALDRSDHELKLLANFYHQHGYLDCAQEIYRTILKIRRDRDARHSVDSTDEGTV